MQRLTKLGRSLVSRMMLPTALMMVASITVPAMAEDLYCLLVKMKNDEKKSFLLSKKPVVSFTATECVVDYDSFTSYFDMSDIKDITIVDDPSGVDEIAAENVTLDYTNPESVVVRGVPSGVTVTLHSLTGMLLNSVKADDQGNAYIDMSAVVPGSVCIISVNSSKNFKIYRK